MINVLFAWRDMDLLNARILTYIETHIAPQVNFEYYLT